MNKKLFLIPAVAILVSLLSVLVTAQDDAAAGLGGVIAFIGAYFVVMLALYVYGALAIMTMAKKTDIPNGWLAFIPVANVYLMTQIAKVEWWYMLIALFFSPMYIYLFWKIAEARGKPGWWSLLLLIPIVNLVILGILAWGK